jgi:hypothetical protein
MQLVGPYRLGRTLGTCQAGSVWAATDAAGGQVTVALLDPVVASDPRWREAFSATANALAHSGGLRALHADFTASTPWVAVAGGPGPGAAQIFTALGQDYHPVAQTVVEAEPTVATAPPVASKVPAQPHAASPVVASSPVYVPSQAAPPDPSPARGAAVTATSAYSPPSQALPVSPAAVSGGPSSGGTPVSAGASGSPISGGPMSGGPISGGPISGAGQWDTREPTPAAGTQASHRRAGVVFAVVALVLLLPGVATAVITTTVRTGGAGATATAPPTGGGNDNRPSAPPWTLVTPAPSQPGLEPPRSAGWPGSWPKLERGARIRPVEVLGVSFPVPQAMNCTRSAQAPGFVRLSCKVTGAAPGTAIEAEVKIRECPYRCDSDRRAELRRAEDAWGRQWNQSGNTAWAENPTLDQDTRYGLIVIVFGRTSTEETLNREVVLRAIGPAAQTNDVRILANAVRDGII